MRSWALVGPDQDCTCTGCQPQQLTRMPLTGQLRTGSLSTRDHYPGYKSIKLDENKICEWCFKIYVLYESIWNKVIWSVLTRASSRALSYLLPDRYLVAFNLYSTFLIRSRPKRSSKCLSKAKDTAARNSTKAKCQRAFNLDMSQELSFKLTWTKEMIRSRRRGLTNKRRT